jgi:hypothetical protein
MKSYSGSPRCRRLLVHLNLWSLGLLLAISVRGEATKVNLVRTPNGGIQPQALADAKGTVHLIYFKGEPKAGDIFYVRRQPGEETFSEPVQVNHLSGSAIAIGTIRGAHVALGRNGRMHAAWNGSKSSDQHPGAPMLYTRLNDAGTAFEPERDLMTCTANLDGGGSVAADDKGNVYVMWHGSKPGSTNGEAGRAVFVARSTDDGKNFAPETPALSIPTGACACCGMRAFANGAGNVFALYRAATEMVNRDEILLVSRNHGADFEIANRHPWKLSACPMSSASLTESRGGVLAAWETAGQIYFSRIAPGTLKVSPPISPPGSASRKHPVVVGNDRGEVLLVWTEGMGWQRGGSLAWQLFDASGQATNEKGRVDGIPMWSFASAVPRGDGGFVIFY